MSDQDLNLKPVKADDEIESSEVAADVAYEALGDLNEGEDGIHFHVPSVDLTFELKKGTSLKGLKTAFKDAFADARQSIEEKAEEKKKPEVASLRR